MPSLKDRIAHAWNAFRNEDWRTRVHSYNEGASYGVRPDRVRLRITNQRSIISSIYTRLGTDAAALEIFHVRRDKDKRYVEDVDSGLNNCLTVEANIDQAPRHFRQDIFTTMFHEGVVAVVPVDVSINPAKSAGFNILTLRVGKVTAWYSKHVKVELYNEDKGTREELILEKKYVAIAENPFFAVMNEPNSTLQRLITKLNLLDVVDEQSSSGKLDIIIQLPYTIKSEARRTAAEQRRKDIEYQLKDSKYGIAYSDATEKITQLNRPAENNLFEQVKYLMEELYRELGLTPEIMAGTASQEAMLNYYDRTIEPLVAAVVEAMRRTFLSKTARSQGQWIMAFRDPFKLVPIKDMAEIADKFTRSEVATSNDLRQAIGWKPSKDPKADELRNTNMPAPSESINPTVREGDSQNGT